MNDLDFLLLSKHIFENKSVEYPFCSQMVYVNGWLDSLNPDSIKSETFNTEKEIVIDLKLEDMNRIIDLLNMCNPSFSIKIIVNDSKDNLISKRLNMKSHSQITFDVDEELLFKPGHIHGGNLVINGNVDSVDLISVLKAAPVPILMRTSIHINGFVTNPKSFCETVFDFITEIVEKTQDDCIHHFSIFVSEIENDYKKTKLIRNWEIVAGCQDNVLNIKVSKIHSLL